jgi:hypothetical protein
LHDPIHFQIVSNSHTVAVPDGSTIIPLAAVWAQENETILLLRLFKPCW